MNNDRYTDEEVAEIVSAGEDSDRQFLDYSSDSGNSILQSVKKILGIMPDCTDFDDVLIMHINSVLMICTQLGVGPESGFAITGSNETWADFVGTGFGLNAVKSYVGLKVRLAFDPPQSSALIDYMTKLVAEYEWRLNANGDPAFSGA